MDEISIEDLEHVAYSSSPQAQWAQQELIKRAAALHEAMPALSYSPDRWPSVIKSAAPVSVEQQPTLTAKKLKKLEKRLSRAVVRKSAATDLKSGDIIRDPLHGHVTVDQTGSSAATGHPAIAGHTPDGQHITLGFDPDESVDVLSDPFVPDTPVIVIPIDADDEMVTG